MSYLISMNPLHLENIAHDGLHDLHGLRDLHGLHNLHDLHEHGNVIFDILDHACVDNVIHPKALPGSVLHFEH